MIFVALAVVWAVYLIPRAVNRSEDELALASTEEVGDAPDEVVDETAPRAVPTAPSAGPGTAPAPAERAAVRRAVAARRRVLLALVALVGLVLVVSLVSPLPLWGAAVPAGLVLTWLAVCRVQVRRLDAARRARAAAAHPIRDAQVTRDAPTETSPDEVCSPVTAAATAEVAPVSREFRVEAPAAPAALVVEPDEDTVGLTEADREAALAEVMPHGAVWDPRPLTLPTYISKPRARRVPRTMVLDAEGVSSSGRDARDSRLVAQGAAAGVEATARPREAVGS